MNDATFTLDALGIKQGDLEDKIVELATERLLRSNYCDEDGQETSAPSRIFERLDKLVKQRIDEAVAAIAEKHVLPNVATYIEKFTIKKTNGYGEAKGEPVSLTEYITQRAEGYLNDPVSYDGKTRDQDSYSWKQHSTRLTYLIHKHLHFCIQIAIEAALKDLNSKVSLGLAEATKLAIAETLAKLKVEVKTR